MCPDEFDYFYPAYGGVVCRDDMVCGRVNSAFCPANHGPAACDTCQRSSGHRADAEMNGGDADVIYEDDGYLPADGEADTYPTEPYELTPEERYDPGAALPVEDARAVPGGVQNMNYEAAWEDEDADGARDGDAARREAFDPGYGYDDAAHVPTPDGNVQTQALAAEARSAGTFSDQPIGSGVPSPRQTGFVELPPPLPSHRHFPAEGPSEELLNKLLPISSPPQPGFLRPTPRD